VGDDGVTVWQEDLLADPPLDADVCGLRAEAGRVLVGADGEDEIQAFRCQTVDDGTEQLRPLVDGAESGVYGLPRRQLG
jgi:hypothetical protein